MAATYTVSLAFDELEYEAFLTHIADNRQMLSVFYIGACRVDRVAAKTHLLATKEILQELIQPEADLSDFEATASEAWDRSESGE